MPTTIVMYINNITYDGLPEPIMNGRVWFISKGQMIPGWPTEYDPHTWVSDADCWSSTKFSDVHRWVTFSLASLDSTRYGDDASSAYLQKSQAHPR